MSKPGDALRRWRKGRDLSQEDAGKLLNPPRTQGTWAAWETGRKPPSLGNALEIERLTGGLVPARAWVPRVRRRRRSAEVQRTGTDG